MDARVSFYNIKTDENMNSLSLVEQLALWSPTVVFWNTEEQLKTLNDKNTFASVKRSGEGSLIEREVNEDIEVFSGSENEITISRVYSVKFYCEYQMAWYPFDQQTCFIEMLTDGVLDNYADLLLGIVEFTGKKELTQYYVKSFTMTKKKIHAKEAVVISITLGRRLLGTFLTIFFPTILLNVIGYSTNYFKEFSLRSVGMHNLIFISFISMQAVITVNLTSMLVLTTMFINVSKLYSQLIKI